METKLVVQPDDEFRTGDFICAALKDHAWLEFRAAVAFVKRSGTKHIRSPLAEFVGRGGTVKISAGLDSGGTSAEGLSDLLKSVNGKGEVFVFDNAGSSTFHPKVYLFKNGEMADAIVGSGNLTEGGLFTNYEAGLHIRLDRGDHEDAAFLSLLELALDKWSTPKDGLCYPLSYEFLDKLVYQGIVPDEARAKADERPSPKEGIKDSGPFTRHPVRGAPKVEKSPPFGEAKEDAAETVEQEKPDPVAGQEGKYRAFVMTLQNTDVGVGQTTAGKQRRSPEIFIPLIARDFDPEFWGWPDQFQKDPAWSGPLDGDGRGKMDRPNVPLRLGGATFPVRMWYNPDKRDLRLRSEYVRSAGVVGDILYLERSDGATGFSYYADVVPQGSPRHAELLAKATNSVRNSKKLFGYFN